MFFNLQQEEQQMDETYEQFEERVLNKRAAHMYHAIKNKLDARDSLTLSEMTHKNSRKQVSKIKISLYTIRLFVNMKVTIKFFLSGCAKVLYLIGFEEIPSFGNKSRILVC